MATKTMLRFGLLSLVILLVFLSFVVDATPSSVGEGAKQQQQQQRRQRQEPHWRVSENRRGTELIEAQGYASEVIDVDTEDGFVLGVIRIPPTYGGQGKPVILQHGFLDTSDTWILNSPQESLGFILADSGYDVWMANSRGNKYSMSNWQGLNPNEDAFWNWSWDEMGQYDLPAVISAVQSATGYQKVPLIGHSQGCTLSIAALSTNQTIDEAISIFIALAPVTYLANQQSTFLSAISALHVEILLGDGEFQPSPYVLSQLLGAACYIHSDWCDDILEPLSGPPQALNSSMLSTYLEHWPDSTSVQDLAHWTEDVRIGGYTNMAGQPYDPSQVDTNVAVFYGANDYLADPTDVQNVISQMGSNVVFTYSNSYSHFDFTWGYNANEEVYNQVLTLLSSYAL